MSTEAVDYEHQLADIAAMDWLYAPKRFDRLHAPAVARYDADEWNAKDVTFACGWQVEAAWIPGIFTRMQAPRCAKCCDAWGYPRGIGSPKNDDACRVLMGLEPQTPRAARLAAQRPAPAPTEES